MNTSAKMAHVLGCVATAITFSTSPVVAEEIDEIIVTAPKPAEADLGLDHWWFNQPKVRSDGTLDEDMDLWEYYLDMQDDYEECTAIADSRVSQCKTTYSNAGFAVCGLTVLYTAGLFARFIPKQFIGAVIPAGTAVGGLQCMDFNSSIAHPWCETEFRTKVIQNCMDEDGS